MNAGTQAGIDTRFRSALRRMQQAGRIRTFAREADPEFFRRARSPSSRRC